MLVGRACSESLAAIAGREHSIRDDASLGDSKVNDGPRWLENVGRPTPATLGSGDRTG